MSDHLIQGPIIFFEGQHKTLILPIYSKKVSFVRGKLSPGKEKRVLSRKNNYIPGKVVSVQ